MYKDRVVPSLPAAVLFGAIDVSFLLNNYLKLLSKGNCLNGQSTYFKFIEQVLTTLPSMVFAPSAIALFNIPFPTDKYTLYYVTTPFITSVLLGFVSKIISKSIAYHDYKQQRQNLASNAEEVDSQNKGCAKVFFNNMANTMVNLSTIAIAVGIGNMFAMLQENNINNPENAKDLTGFYFLAPSLAYNSTKALCNLVVDSYRGSKAIKKTISSWCFSGDEETAGIVNSGDTENSVSTTPVVSQRIIN